MRRPVLLLVVAISLVIPTSALARVRLVSMTSPVSAGSDATLTVSVSPARKCSIEIAYKTRKSEAKGLHPKQPHNGRVSWTWKVGTNTTKGRWTIVVSCGSAGTLKTSFLVR
jgi:micrococcal nuclease